MSFIHIIRGLPGSGKSTFAKKLAQNYNCNHYEADMYFVNEQGEYKFNPQKIGAAHAWCYNKVRRDLMDYRPVVISNTFTRYKELEAYVGLVQEIHSMREAGLYKSITPMFIIHDMIENYGNIHNVPDSTIEKMKARWEPMQEIRLKIKQVYPHIGVIYHGQEIH